MSQADRHVLEFAERGYTVIPDLVSRGDVYFGHYLLGHNIGGNVSTTMRKVAYFRLHAEGHRQRWQQCIQDPWFEFEPVAQALAAKKHALAERQ
jgi:hypothetical protein